MWSTTLIVVLIVILLLVLIDREIYFYEGTHLTPSVQAWLYDRWATKYDFGKRESQKQDGKFLAQPLLEELAHIPKPFILDIATGTGRLPYALMNTSDFDGHIVAVDISRGMLTKAIHKLSNKKEKIDFMHYERFPLPFPDHSFDAIVCLEALEVMPEMNTPLSEFKRLLRPGGTLLTSRGTELSGRKAKVIGADKFKELLEKFGFARIEITAWWRVFDRVFAQKPGKSMPVGYESIVDILLCHNCGHKSTQKESSTELCCTNCKKKIPVEQNGIILYPPR